MKSMRLGPCTALEVEIQVQRVLNWLLVNSQI